MFTQVYSRNIAVVSLSILLPYSPLCLEILEVISLFNLMILSWAFFWPSTESCQNPSSPFCIILLKFRQINKPMTNNIIFLEGVMTITLQKDLLTLDSGDGLDRHGLSLS